MTHSAACSRAVRTTSLTLRHSLPTSANLTGGSFGKRLTNVFVNSIPKSASEPLLTGDRVKKGTVHAKSIGASLVRPW